MRVKHGIYPVGTDYEFHWVGEKVTAADFNDRLRSQTASVAKDINSFIEGFDAKKTLNAGQRTLIELKTLEEVAKLPLCGECRKLIGEVQ